MVEGTTRDSSSSKTGRQKCCRRMAAAEPRRWSGFGLMIRSFAESNVGKGNVDGRQTSRTPPSSSVGSDAPYEISSQNSTHRRQRQPKSRAYCPLGPRNGSRNGHRKKQSQRKHYTTSSKSGCRRVSSVKELGRISQGGERKETSNLPPKFQIPHSRPECHQRFIFDSSFRSVDHSAAGMITRRTQNSNYRNSEYNCLTAKVKLYCLFFRIIVTQR
jgi:hypothetical protein